MRTKMGFMSSPLLKLSIFVLLAGGCSTSAGGSLTGRVVLAGLDTVSGVEVAVLGPSNATVSPAPNGVYRIDLLPDGKYVVVASASSTAERSQMQLVTISGGVGAVPDIQLSPRGTVVGTVLGGQHVAIAVVGSAAATTSDRSGHYSLSDVPIGPQTIAASAGSSRATTQVVVSYNMIADAADLDLRPAPPAPGGVTGNAQLIGATSSAGIIVTAVGPIAASAITDTKGAFTIGQLPAGDYTVTYAASATVEKSQSANVTIAASVSSLPPVVFHAAGTVAGIATLDGSVTRSGGIAVFTNQSKTAFTNDSGHYTILDVPVGANTLSASHAGYDTPQVDISVDYGNAITAPPLSLALSATNPGSVHGVAQLFGLTDHGGTSVSLLGTVISTTTASDGSFDLVHIPADAYSVVFDNGPYHEEVPNVVIAQAGAQLFDHGNLIPLPTIVIPHAHRIYSPALSVSGLSADGRSVIFFGPTGLFSGIVDGSALTSFADDSGSTASAYSHDGTAVFFTGYGIQLVTLASSTSFSAGPQPVCTISGDAHYAVCIEQSSFQVIKDNGMAFTVSKTISTAVFSPDSTKLAYANSGAANLIDLATKADTELSKGSPGMLGAAPVLRFSTDGKTLFYLDNEIVVHVIDVIGTGRTTLGIAVQVATMTNPHQIALCRSGALRIVDFTTAVVLGTDSCTNINDHHAFAVSPSGAYAVYQTPTETHSMRLSDGLVTNLGPAGPFEIAPDSSGIAILGAGIGLQPLAFVPIAGGPLVPLDNCLVAGMPPYEYNPASFGFSADSQHVFCHHGIDGTDISIAPISGSAPTVLASQVLAGAYFGISPDATRAWSLNGTSMNAYDAVAAKAVPLLPHAIEGPRVWLDGYRTVIPVVNAEYSYQNGLYVVPLR